MYAKYNNSQQGPYSEGQTAKWEEGWMGASVKPYEEKLKVSTPLTQRFTEQLTQQTADADGLIASEAVVVE